MRLDEKENGIIIINCIKSEVDLIKLSKGISFILEVNHLVLKSFPIRPLRSLFGVVAQDSQLFQGSILENITEKKSHHHLILNVFLNMNYCFFSPEELRYLRSFVLVEAKEEE